MKKYMIKKILYYLLKNEQERIIKEREKAGLELLAADRAKDFIWIEEAHEKFIEVSTIYFYLNKLRGFNE